MRMLWQWLDEALETARLLEDPYAVFIIRGNEGLARVFLHQLDAATEAFRAGFAICHEAATENLVDEPLLRFGCGGSPSGRAPAGRPLSRSSPRP